MFDTINEEMETFLSNYYQYTRNERRIIREDLRKRSRAAQKSNRLKTLNSSFLKALEYD